jgi:uracil-DNA glycosylase
MPGGRILGTVVPMLLPPEGPVHVLIVGEAPGPRGADKSGIPFFGDGAGRHLYAALQRLGAADLPARVADVAWDGAVLTAAGFAPVAHGVALGNAFDRCPTDNGHTFRAPLRSELEGAANFARLARDLVHLRTRGLKGIVTLGRVAARTVDTFLAQHPAPDIARRSLPHPSAQGLLSMAPDRGKGAKMSALQEEWMVRCQQAIVEVGFPAPPHGIPTGDADT